MPTSSRLDRETLVRPAIELSRFWRAKLAAWPEFVAALDPALPALEPVEAMYATLAGELGLAGGPLVDEEACKRALRRFKYAQLLRVTLRDLWQVAANEIILREITHVAEAITRAAVDYARARMAQKRGRAIDASGAEIGFVVLGMGKLGGYELNYSSDVDFIYLYASDEGHVVGVDGAAHGDSPHDYFTRLARQIGTLLSELTPDGFCYRVDLDLRPEGTQGPLVNGVDAALRYYENWGRTWERGALAKARAFAGDVALGEGFIEALQPFVYRRAVDAGVIGELTEMKRRIDARGGTVEAGRAGFDVKLGSGGIRELEFFVQGFQLLYGGKRAELRVRGTRAGLRVLRDEGLISEGEATQLEQAYDTLRRVENRIQMLDERQTALLPAGEDLALVARAMSRPATRPRTDELIAGYSAGGSLGRAFAGEGEGGDEEQIESFVWMLRAATSSVARSYTSLMPESGVEAADETVAFLLDGDLESHGDAEVAARLHARFREAGFVDAEQAAYIVRRLRMYPQSLFAGGAGPAARRAARMLLGELLQSPDPDQALVHLNGLLSRWGAHAALPGILARSPGLARLLLTLFGTSDELSRVLNRAPELFDTLLLVHTAEPLRGRGAINANCRGYLAQATGVGPETVMPRLSRFRQHEFLRIGMNDIAGVIAGGEVWSQLTYTAEAIVEQALRVAEREVKRRYGTPRNGAGEELAFVVLGLGKLGSASLGYHSDLDLLMVYEGSANEGETDGKVPHGGEAKGQVVTAGEYFAKLGQKLISALTFTTETGPVYAVDMRLRPSGTQGPLVVSREAFARYQMEEAALWERLAMVRARKVAWTGGMAGVMLAGEVEAIQRRAAFERALEGDAAQQIVAMRRRIEEHAREKLGDLMVRVKQGAGGLLDIEFLNSWLVLRHGRDETAMRVVPRPELWASHAKAGYVSVGDAQTLAEAYAFLRKVESRVAFARGGGATASVGRRRGDGVARRMGYRDGDGVTARDRLEKELAQTTAVVRAMFEKYLV